MESSIQVARGFESTREARRGVSRAGRRWGPAALTAAIIFVLLVVAAVAPRNPGRAWRGTQAPWNRHLQEMDTALAAQDGQAARRAWDAAYAIALSTGSWDGMAAVGDAVVRLGEQTGHLQEGVRSARTLYQIAFFRAQQQQSAEGMLRAAEGFAGVGDLPMADLALRVAGSMAGDSTDIRVRDGIQALQHRLAAAQHPAAMP